MASMKWLVTGGCGFIGTNAVSRFLKSGCEVVVVDNLERAGAHINREWLEGLGGKFTLVQADIRDADGMRRVVARHRPDAMLHLAAQVAVTTSVLDPRTDFEVNALGTLNLLEAVRLESPETIVVYSSTNKVYGQLEHLPVEETDRRYLMPEMPFGIAESEPMDFHSPYGCSKGVADQYVRDYARVFGLKTVVFRQSCIYGPHQFGIEDQGWVAWLTIAAQTGQRITIYGNGKQVRDVLYVDDLVDCYERSVERINRVSGEVFNMGGGPANTMSLKELLGMLEERCGHRVPAGAGATRPGDQPLFVADIRKAAAMLDWTPKVGPADGVTALFDWVKYAVANGVVTV